MAQKQSKGEGGNSNQICQCQRRHLLTVFCRVLTVVNSAFPNGSHCPFMFNIHIKQRSYYKWFALEEATQETAMQMLF